MRPHARGITLVVLEVDELRVALLGHEDLALLPHTGVEDAGYCYLECGDQGLLGLNRDAPLEQPLTGPEVKPERTVAAQRPLDEAALLCDQAQADRLPSGHRHDMDPGSPDPVQCRDRKSTRLNSSH